MPTCGSPITSETEPEELFQNSSDRIESAKDAHRRLRSEIDGFMDRIVRRMLYGYDPKRKSYVVKLPPARHAQGAGFTVSGRPNVTFSQIAENLRSALDYVVFELSEKRSPDLNRRDPQFVIATDKASFLRQSRKCLEHLDSRETAFVERLQPYHGNETLRALRNLTNNSKHRRLLSLEQSGSLEIALVDREKQEEFAEWNVVPVDDNHAFCYRRRDFALVLMKYDAMRNGANDDSVHQVRG